jgi:hypothetical protein
MYFQDFIGNLTCVRRKMVLNAGLVCKTAKSSFKHRERKLVGTIWRRARLITRMVSSVKQTTAIADDKTMIHQWR